MATLPLRVIVSVLLLLIAAGMVALTFVAATAASDSIEVVALSLVDQISLRVEETTLGVVQTPFHPLEGLINTVRGTLSIERADGAGFLDSLRYIDGMMSSISGNNVITANEYGHIQAVYGMQSHGRHMVGSAPPMDLVVPGVPSWALPCRYQANCTDPSNALNHKYCANPSDPWAESGGVAPAWARGGRAVGSAESLAAYPALDPPYATWATAQNPNSAERTTCRGNAQGPKPECPEGCPEFNATFFLYPADRYDQLQAVRDLPNYDPRVYAWYYESRPLMPGKKYFSDVFVCATTNGLCLTATIPYHTYVPEVGATVSANGSVGVVQGYVHTIEEMHTPVVRMADGRTEVLGRHTLSLACTDAPSCDTAGVGNASLQALVPKFVGIVGSAFYLDSLTEIGSSFQVGKTGGVFIGDFSDEALLITSGFQCDAAKMGQSCFAKPSAQGNTVRVSAFDPHAGHMVSSVMGEMFSPVQDATGKWRSVEHQRMGKVLDASVKFGGSEYWVRFRRIRPDDVHNVNWWVCVVVPHDDYLEEIRQNQVVSLAVSVGAMALLMVSLLLLTVIFFLRPISCMIDDFNSACLMKLEDIPDRSGGVVRELSVLQVSFGVLVSNLYMYRPFLPPSCFGLEESEEEEVEESEKGTANSASRTSCRESSASPSGCSFQRARPIAALKEHLSSGLRRKKVTIMAANATGFTTLVSSFPVYSELVDIHASFLERMLHAAAPKGVAEAFSGDRFVFSFNALSNQGTPDMPFSAALRVADVELEQCTLQVGVAQGDVLCGTLGTETMKKFSLIGPCYGASIVLMSLAKHYCNTLTLKSPILMEQRCAERANSCNFEATFVDVLMMPKLSSKRVQLWCLLHEGNAESGAEWMYTYKEGNETDKEWFDFLAGRDHDYNCPRITALVKADVSGLTYVGADPGIAELCG